MAILKIDLPKALSHKNVIIELGCGQRIKNDRINIDRLDLPGVDIVADIENGLPFLPDNSTDEIHSKSFLEHIENFEFLMKEIHRVLKTGGRKHIFVPHFSNPYYYSDYTHKKFFGLYTFEYFVGRENQLKRKVPVFYQDVRFKVVSRKLIFKSPFYGRNVFKKVLQFIFNLTPYMQEFYEENLCYVFPCYGIRIVLTPDK